MKDIIKYIFGGIAVMILFLLSIIGAIISGVLSIIGTAAIILALCSPVILIVWLIAR